LVPGPSDADPHDLTRVGLHVYLVADDGQHGAELWAVDLASRALLAGVGTCMTGPGDPDDAVVQPSVELCVDALDADFDGDVDLLDAAGFQNRLPPE
jgi:hypothetical protein